MEILIMEKYLPLGSIVHLVNAQKLVMIIGYGIKGEKKNKIYDYVGCIYPEGFISYKENLVFDQTRIDEIISLGYKNDWVEAETVIKQFVKELESEKKNE